MQLKIDRIKLGITSCYLIRGEGVVLVDCGDMGRGESFIKALNDMNIKPHAIRLIVLTHGHADHTGSAKAIAKLTKAKVAIHHADAKWLVEGQSALAVPVTLWAKILSIPMAHKPVSAMFNVVATNPDVVIYNEVFSLYEYGIPGKVIHTPGHTDGSICLVLESGGAIVGDMAMNGFPSIRSRAGLPIFAKDLLQLKMSWQKLLREDIKQIYPGHGKPFPVEEFTRQLERISG